MNFTHIFKTEGGNEFLLECIIDESIPDRPTVSMITGYEEKGVALYSKIMNLPLAAKSQLPLFAYGGMNQNKFEYLLYKCTGVEAETWEDCMLTEYIDQQADRRDTMDDVKAQMENEEL